MISLKKKWNEKFIKKIRRLKSFFLIFFVYYNFLRRNCHLKKRKTVKNINSGLTGISESGRFGNYMHKI